MITTIVVVVTLWVLILLGMNSPLANWKSYGRVFELVIKDHKYPLSATMRMLRYLIKDLLLSPVHCLLWILDEALYGRRISATEVANPVFIISQPRSGSTFLHRTLAEDDETFFALTYLEWHWPYICVWRLLDLLHLRAWVNSWNYWPNNAAGRRADKMHPHKYGDHEEHGVFLEEHFYHHYFVFRRFPFHQLLNVTTNITTLPKDDRVRILAAFVRTVQKVAYYRGHGRVWLTKENESVDFYRQLIRKFKQPRVIFLVRDHQEMIASYITLSHESTMAKTGINFQRDRQRWHQENITFRRLECDRFFWLYRDMCSTVGHAALLDYNKLNKDLATIMLRLYYNTLRLHYVPTKQVDYLRKLADDQEGRTRDYFVSRPSSFDLTGFRNFAELVEQSHANRT